ncbi:hypothetical protein J1N35_008237 [Gossypium stocksii]|uniref:Uncharacterized protein n=1 Tax=Gossypium stocksii TaxID=47602 RepID=A0A9D3W7T9_9ROSI|nr:hypothetical protein J1N35_008237 [Gossypium stocksii]
MTAGSFTLANYVEGYSSSPASLNMTIESFALANCVEGYGPSPVSFNMITPFQVRGIVVSFIPSSLYAP